ncbi:MAG TPA: PKD domain-containing protein [Baekduia sp.]|nr:PKD domain-containing protein [Baekduia sp.]
MSACLLAAALAAAASHVPSAHASFGQLGPEISQWGDDDGQVEEVRGLGRRGAQTYVLDRVGRSIADPSDPTGPKLDVTGQRIQRFGADGKLVGDGPLLERDEDADYSYPAEGAGTDPGYNVMGFAVDPRASGSLLYLARQNIFDSAQGRIDAFDADTGAYVSSFPASEIRGTTNASGTIFQPEKLAVDPTNGDVFVAGYKGDNNDPPLLRGFPAGGGARKVAVPLTDATPATPTAANPRLLHDFVAGMAVGADGTLAVLSAGTYLWGSPSAEDPSAGVSSDRFVEVFGASGATRTRTAVFPVAEGESIAVLSGGNVVVGAAAKLTEYTPAGAIVRTWGKALAAGDDPAPGGCALTGVPVVAATAGGVLASSFRSGAAPVGQVAEFGDGGHGCGPQGDFTPGSPKKGTPATFAVLADEALTGLPESAFTWTFSDGGSAVGRSVQHTFGAAGKATVTLTVASGELDAARTRTVTVSGVAPTAAIAFGGPDGAVAGTTLSFDGSGSKDADGSIKAYQWEFGDGTTAAGVAVSHAYAAAGKYAVKLTVTDDDGATASTNKFVTVAAPPSGGGGGGGGGGDTTPVPRSTPDPPSGPTKAQSAGTLKITGGTLTLDAKGKLKVKLTCSAGSGPCAGKLTLVSAKAIAAKAGKKAVLTLGTVSYSVPAGTSVTVTLKVSAKALKAIKKSKSMAIRLKATGSDGATATASGTAKAAAARKAKR